MRTIVLLTILLFVALGAFFTKDFWWNRTTELVAPIIQTRQVSTKFNPYTFENLRQRSYPGSQIKLEKVLKEDKGFTSYLFSFQTDGKKVTGQANLPQQKGKLPVVVMIRGYIDDQNYFTGAGTSKVAGVFAQNGFITLAPDFLGFGGSDSAGSDILEARFEKPITVLNLLSSIKTLPQANPEKVFIWGHSNGGQVALSVLEVSQKPTPTTLWAPVTKGFPDSVLTYMEEMDDQGLKVKAAIDEFLQDYDPKKYSVDEYFVDIKAPLQLHQGTNDPLVPIAWSDGFVSRLELLGKEITYRKYKGNDHNLKQGWDLVVARDLEFFRKNF